MRLNSILDAGIGDEVNNLDALSKNTKSEELAKAAGAAKGSRNVLSVDFLILAHLDAEE